MSIGKESEEVRKRKSEAAKARAASQKVFDPGFYHRIASRGGSAKVPKGAALHTEEQQKEFSAKGVAARKLKKEQS